MTDQSVGAASGNGSARLLTRDDGVGSIADDTEQWHSAGTLGALSQVHGKGPYPDNGLGFASHDGVNNTVDISAGRAYVMASGVQYQTTLGGASQPAFDATLTDDVPLVVHLPSAETITSMADATLSDVWLAVDTDGTGPGATAGDIYVRHGTGLSPPSHPSVYLGQTNPDDATADNEVGHGPPGDIRRVNVVEAGMDPSGNDAVDTIFDTLVADDTELFFPPGTYFFDAGHRFQDTTNFRLVGTEDTVIKIESTFTDEPTLGAPVLFNAGESGGAADTSHDFQMRNFTIDMSAATSGCQVLLAHVEGNKNRIENITVTGERNDSFAGSGAGEFLARVDVVDEDGFAVIDGLYSVDGAANGGVGDPFTGLYIGGAHTGSVVIENSAVFGYEDNAIYTSEAAANATSSVIIRNCWAGDTGVAAIRTGGANTLVSGCVISQNTAGKGAGNPRGLWLRAGHTTVERTYVERTGTVAADCVEINGGAGKSVLNGLYVSNQSTDTSAAVVVVSDTEANLRTFNDCFFEATAIPGGDTELVQVNSANVTFRDCELDAVVGDGTNRWFGLELNDDEARVIRGKWRADRYAIWDRSTATNTVVRDIILAEDATIAQDGIHSDGDDFRFYGDEDNIVPAPTFDGARYRINGVGVESAAAETPTAASWDTGDIVDFTDSGDGSGDGVYLLLADGTWSQIGT